MFVLPQFIIVTSVQNDHALDWDVIENTETTAAFPEKELRGWFYDWFYLKARWGYEGKIITSRMWLGQMVVFKCID